MKTVEFANSVDLVKVALNDILGITRLTMLYQGMDRFYLSHEEREKVVLLPNTFSIQVIFCHFHFKRRAT